MFKQDPIVFRQAFKNKSWFIPYTNEKDGSYIKGREILIKPFLYRVGAGISFEIYDLWIDRNLEDKEPRRVYNLDCFDHEHPDLMVSMQALAFGEAQGTHAQGIAFDLYKKLLLPDEMMKQLLPLVVEDAIRYSKLAIK